jgi:hypothetical protein
VIESTGTNVFTGLKNSGAVVYIGSDNNGSFLIQTPGSAFSTKMLVDTTGNVGIGTSSPGAKLQVQGLIRTSSATSGLQIDRRDTSVSAYTLYSSAGNLQFYNGTSDVMVLDSSGNLGIGTTSPGAMLDVAGRARGGLTNRKGVYTAGATTPSVSGVSYLDVSNSSATTITNFTNGAEGQLLYLLFRDGNTTITRNNAYLAGGTNFTSAANATLLLISDGTSWYEVSRSTTNA